MPGPRPTPLVVAIEMGYGHLRAAEPLAERLGTEVLHADRPPLADDREQRLWHEARRWYELGSRLSQLPAVGKPLELALEALTHIPPLHPYRDLSAPTASARTLERFARRGLGQLLIDRMKSTGGRRAGERSASTAWSPTATSTAFGRRSIPRTRRAFATSRRARAPVGGCARMACPRRRSR
jgi:hypothetical protein